VATVSVSVSLARYEEALEAAAQIAVRRGGWTRKSSRYRPDHAIEAERARAHAFRRPQGVLRRSGWPGL